MRSSNEGQSPAWRLPRVEELATLMMEKAVDSMDPRFEGEAFPFSSEPNGYYWAITDFAFSPAASAGL